MSASLLNAIDSICNEKSLEKEDIFGALEAAVAAAYRRKQGLEMDVRAEMDRDTGDYQLFRRWLVMDDEDPAYESPDYHLLLSQAKVDNPDIKVGDYVEEEMDRVPSGRIYAHITKQVIMQKVKEVERARVADMYRDRVKTLVMGTVKRDEFNGITVDFGNNAEGFIPREHLIPREKFRLGESIRAYLLRIEENDRFSQLVLSRTVPEFLKELFKLEVPEVGQEVIEVIGAVRDPGLRAKISVRSNDARLDPVGVCVGMRGSRVQAVSNELAGERIDIILWDEDPSQYVINAMSPADISSIVADEDRKVMEIAVEEEKLSQAIGRGGQNVRLASQLVGWKLDVMSKNQAEEKKEEETQKLLNLFREKLGVDEEVANILVQEGFSSIDEIAYLPQADLLKIEEFDSATVEEMRTRASDALLSMAMSGELQEDEQAQQIELIDLEGMDEETYQKLLGNGIASVEDLAYQSVDDLLDASIDDREYAAKLIMAARKPWFDKKDQESGNQKDEESGNQDG